MFQLRKYLASTLALLVIIGCQTHHIPKEIKTRNQSIIKDNDVVQNIIYKADKKDEELPAKINLAKHSLHDKHCYRSCPINTNSKNIEIEHGGFILSYNITTKYADWVAYKLNRDKMSGDSAERIWKADPKLPSEFAMIPKDYKDAYKTCNYDRGHQAPLADFSNAPEKVYTNYLSNITPQKAPLNRGAWYNLEHSMRELAKNNTGSIYVMTGPYYNGKPTCSLPHARLPNIIPNGYWKIVILDEGNKVFKAGFIFDQDTPKSSDYCIHKAKVQDIAKLTNLILPSVYDANKSLLLYERLGRN